MPNLDLTVLLPLKDHPECTKEWLKHNYFEELNYYVADGSIGAENYEIFKNFSKKNIKYKRYNPDFNIEDFITKICKSLSDIKTEYVMFCDNDDYLLINGIKNLYDHIKSNNNYDGIQGKVPWVNENKNGVLRRTTIEWFGITELNTGIQGLSAIINNYNQLWYAIYRTEVQKNIFEKFMEIKCNNIYLIEEFQTYIAISLYKIEYLDRYYYVRTKSSRSSSSHFFSSLKNSLRYHFILNEDYLIQFSKLANYLSQKLNYDSKELFNMLRNRKIIESGFSNIRFRNLLTHNLTRFILNLYDTKFRLGFEKKNIQDIFK